LNQAKETRIPTLQDADVLTAFDQFSDVCDLIECRKALHRMFSVFATHNDASKERIEETAYYYQHLTEFLFSLQSIEAAATVE
jgi:hypothetical protein